MSLRKTFAHATWQLLGALCVFCLTGTALAAQSTSKPSASAAAGTSEYEKFTKGAQQQPGLFPVWRKEGKLYLELRDDQLDADYLEHIVPANGLGGYGFNAGQQFAQAARLVRFHEAGKQIVMIWPPTRFVARPGTALAAAVQQSSADSVEAILPVVAQNATAKTRIVDLSPLLGDLLDLGNQLSDAIGADKTPAKSYHLDPARTYFGASKAFPQNVLLEVDQTFAAQKADAITTVADARFVQMRVKYNFAQLPDSSGYMPRLYDDRVGYWEDSHVTFDNDAQRDNHLWYILRWNVQRSDPSQKISPAKKAIVFYLDDSIPVEYRAEVRAGVLEWNKAFERIGIGDAVQVQDRPADPAWDPDDIRYSVIRWVTDDPSQFGAEAQIVWDPRSGEIFRGGVLLDGNLARFAKFTERTLLSALSVPGAVGAIEPQSGPATYAPRHAEAAFNSGERAEAAFGATALSLLGQSGELDTFVRERLKAVVLHEIGHDFGLSHNFIAHNAYTPADLKNAAFTRANGTSASVMDYWAVNLWPRGTSGGTYYPTTLGPYDYHVIHWGYEPVSGAQTPQQEVPVLDRWASAAVDPRYAFAGDEDGFYNGHAVDPRVAPFVMTNRPMDWCSTQLDLTKKFIASLDARFPQPQEPWAEERAAFLSLFGRYVTCASSLTHYIAGEYLSRGRIGDPGVHTALTPVPRNEEKRAYRLLERYVFSETAWRLSPLTLNRLVYTEYMPVSTSTYDPAPRHDVPVVALIGTLQNDALAYMYSPLVLQRLADLPTKSVPGQTMTVADLFGWTQHAIFRNLAHGGSQIHRNLQRRYARLLAQMVTAPAPGTPLDAQALARYELVDLQRGVKKALTQSALDLQTRAHLRALQVDVQRALEARIIVPAAGPA